MEEGYKEDEQTRGISDRSFLAQNSGGSEDDNKGEEEEGDIIESQDNAEEIHGNFSILVDLVQKGEPEIVCQCISGLYDNFLHYPDYVVGVMSQPSMVENISFFMDTFDPDITFKTMGILNSLLDKMDDSIIPEENMFITSKICVIISGVLKKSMPIRYVNDVIKFLEKLIKKWDYFVQEQSKYGIVTTIMDILNFHSTEKVPSRPANNPDTKFDYTDDSIDMTSSSDDLTKSCIEYVSTFLLSTSSNCYLAVNEAIDYLILYSFYRYNFPDASEIALHSFSQLLKANFPEKNEVIAQEFVKCQKCSELLGLAFDGNIEAWYCIIDLIHLEGISKIFVEKNLFGFLEDVLNRSKECDANPELINTADRMRLLALNTLIAFTCDSENNKYFQRIATSNLVVFIIEYMSEGTISIRNCACNAFSNLISTDLVFDLIMERNPNFPLQALQNLTALKTEEQSCLIDSLISLVEKAIKIGGISPIDLIGGDEGIGLIEEFVDIADINVFPGAQKLLELVTCENSE